MKNDTHLNILVSYAYLFGQKDFLLMLEKNVNKKINLMLDSGAFTKFNAKTAMKHINVKDYVDWLKDYAWMSEKYVMLDVVGNAEKSKKNYEYMLSQGLNPMYVVTMFDKDFDYIREAVKQNPHICVAGGVTTKSDWMTKRFQDIYRNTEGKAKMHGLGYVTFPRMLQQRLVSVDSSTWCTAPARFGCFVFFSTNQSRIYQIQWREVLKGRTHLDNEVRLLFQKHGITPAMFCDKKYHKCEGNIEKFMSIIQNIKLQKYAKRNNLDYFMACGSIDDLKRILVVNDNPNIQYKEFQQLCS